ncbi:MAG: GatB/YqeY domain-containing protein [Planctomycetota bacterium]
MSVQEEVSRQMKEALKSGRKDRLRVLRMLKSELQVAERSGRAVDEVSVVKSYAKSLRQNAEEYEELGREEAAEAVRRDLDVVEEFLPEQMGREDLEALIEEVIEEQDLGPGDIGPLMKTVMSRHGDVVDGSLAQEIARQKLIQS